MLLGHGSGGQLSAALMRDLIGPALGASGAAGPLNDAAVVELAGQRLAFTTDSFVVSPLIFPGGDIGELAVNGTVNDLAMMGAGPWRCRSRMSSRKGCRSRTCAPSPSRSLARQHTRGCAWSRATPRSSGAVPRTACS